MHTNYLEKHKYIIININQNHQKQCTKTIIIIIISKKEKSGIQNSCDWSCVSSSSVIWKIGVAEGVAAHPDADFVESLEILINFGV